MTEFNKEVVISTLKQLVEILKRNNIEYRFLGSVVIAAINGELHRNLGDLDLIIDAKGKDILFKELTKLGYYQAGGMFSFARKYLALETLEHSRLLGIGYFYGTWQNDKTFLMGNKNVNVLIETQGLLETKYSLYGLNFVGIPQRVAATGVKASETNPKRKRERQLLIEKGIKPLPNSYIHVSILGLKADWIYYLSMASLNIIGNIRVRLGFAFDPWR
jgi:hypothetical protein